MFATLLSLSLTATHAGGWTATFGPDTATYLDSEGHAAIVVAAGQDTECRAVGDAVVQALRSSGRAKLVMTDESLPAVSKLGDEEIVTKAKRLPVDDIVIVRVFPGPGGKRNNAVGTVYDKSGTVLAAFNAERGIPLSPRVQTAAPSGVSSHTLAAVDSVEHPNGEPESDAQKKYDEQYVWFQDGATVDLRTGATLATWSVPMQGKYQRELAVDEFLDVVGHPDLAQQYRSRHRLKLGLIGGGITGMTAGGVLMLAGLVYQGPCYRADASSGVCMANASSPVPLISGAVLGGVGLAAMIWGIVLSNNTVTGPEARKMAEDYNQNLKSNLKLSEADDGGDENRVVLNFMAIRQGGGMQLGVRF